LVVGQLQFCGEFLTVILESRAPAFRANRGLGGFGFRLILGAGSGAKGHQAA